MGGNGWTSGMAKFTVGAFEGDMFDCTKHLS